MELEIFIHFVEKHDIFVNSIKKKKYIVFCSFLLKRVFIIPNNNDFEHGPNRAHLTTNRSNISQKKIIAMQKYQEFVNTLTWTFLVKVKILSFSWKKKMLPK